MPSAFIQLLIIKKGEQRDSDIDLNKLGKISLLDEPGSYTPGIPALLAKGINTPPFPLQYWTAGVGEGEVLGQKGISV